MKKYIPFVAVYFAALIAATLIDQNNNQTPPPLPHSTPDPAVAQTIYPISTAEPFPTVPPFTPLNDTPTSIDIPFDPTQPSPDPDNLIQNGYFLNDFEGWERILIDEGGSSKASIRESNNSPFNRELYIEQTGKGEIIFKLLDPIQVNSINLILSLTFKGNKSDYEKYSYAGIKINYLDLFGNVLGNTYLFSRYVRERRTDSNITHNISFQEGKVQSNYTIKLADEVSQNLLGINPNDIRFIDIQLYAGTTFDNEFADLAVSDIVLKYYY